MKRGCIAIALFVVVTGCDAVTAPQQQQQQPPPPPPPPLSEFFTLSGRIEDVDGGGLSGARVQLTTPSTIQTTLSGNGGEYRFDNVRGTVELRVSKDGFIDASTTTFSVDKERTLNITLQQLLILAPGTRLIPGTTLRGTVQAPPCDRNWDAGAYCQRLSFIPPVTGVYELVLNWKGPSELDLLVDQSFSLYWSSATGPIRALVTGDAGVEREIRIQSYYSPQTFELTASLWTAP
jgi:hypothetical protein